MINKYKSTLFECANSLIKKQIHHNHSSVNGGFLCSSCKLIHGRSVDAIYAFAICYKLTKDGKYLNAINALLDYANNLICDDGGMYNDMQALWRYTTVFQEICLCETYLSCQKVLPSSVSKRIFSRIKLHAEWLYQHLDEKTVANINYPTSNSLALYLAGSILNNQKYLKQSKHLLNYALKHITINNLFYGESQPHNLKTKKGCLAIDIGYNLEESLLALGKYAFYSKDINTYKKVLKLAKGHLPFILPDGAIDNSLGCRNYKWTYYGSRTCDGLIPLFYILGKDDKRFIEAANRNFALMLSCTHNGLLYGGPDYFKHKENPCLHHTFEHINSFAFVVDHFLDSKISTKKQILPSEEIFDTYIKEMDAYRLANHKYLLSISNYDINIPYSGHLTSGAITLLYDKKNKRPMIVGSVGDYQLTEPNNMQVPLDVNSHLPGYPRIDAVVNNKYYSTGYFNHCEIIKKDSEFKFISYLTSRDGLKLNDKFSFTYKFTEGGLMVTIKSQKDFIYKIPLISGQISIKKGKLLKIEDSFFLTPGFMMKQYNIASKNHQLEIVIK